MGLEVPIKSRNNMEINFYPCMVCKKRQVIFDNIKCSLKRQEFWNDIPGYEENEKKLPLNVCKFFEKGEPDVKT